MSYPALILIAALLTLVTGSSANAEPPPHSGTLTGPLGLNIVPSARMDSSGTITAGVSTLDPYLHGFIGIQLADPLYVNIRQSAETSSLSDEAKRLYPGVDTKLRLLREGKYTPEIALGMQSMVGHKRMAGEYLAFSKRYQDFDFTAGMGWGRYGSAGHFKNPLKSVSGHFGKNRAHDDEISVRPQDWFTGENIGLFGGVEYFTPVDGLSLKLDIGADRYSAETAAGDFDKPAPWSAGFNFRPASGWFDAGIAVMGLDKIMARFTLRTFPERWNTSAASPQTHHPMRAHRSPSSSPAMMQTSARNDGALLYDLQRDGAEVSATLELNDHHPAPYQIRAAAINMANHAGTEVETITIRPARGHLKGAAISLNRRDLENALARQQGSADEIWMNAQFDTARSHAMPTSAFQLRQLKPAGIRFLLDNDISLSEKDSGTLYRTSLIGEMRGVKLLGLLQGGTALRLNLADNLERLEEIRPQSLLPVRGDVAAFANSTLSLERSYLGLSHSFTPEWHAALAGGYLEEMYGGFGGEILYRPFGKRFALGAESWLAVKRDPHTALDLGFTLDHVLSLHLNGWYTFPDQGLTLKAKFGRYLAEDIGATLALEKSFRNGVQIEGFTTLTDQSDFDIFGGTTHAYSGLRMTIPLGAPRYIPDGSAMRITASPLGRDIGQTIDAPINLYRETDPLSYEHMAQHWSDITH